MGVTSVSHSSGHLGNFFDSLATSFATQQEPANEEELNIKMEHHSPEHEHITEGTMFDYADFVAHDEDGITLAPGDILSAPGSVASGSATDFDEIDLESMVSEISGSGEYWGLGMNTVTQAMAAAIAQQQLMRSKDMGGLGATGRRVSFQTDQCEREGPRRQRRREQWNSEF